MTYRGRVESGAIVLEPAAELPEGAEVRVEVGDLTPFDPIFDFSDLAVETGITDLATNIDHYLYGHPSFICR